MLQSLDVISVNLWQILISLANLVLLFLLVKRFLFRPVKRVMIKRQSELDKRYTAAEEAVQEANESKKQWDEKLNRAQDEAASIVSAAAENAKGRSEKIVSEAKDRAERIVHQAETEAALAYKKAADDMKREIVNVSGALAEKMLAREINTKDHRGLIDSFIKKIGDDDGGSE